jgi:putative redox protein
MTVTVTAHARQPYRQTITAGNHTYYADAPLSNGGQDTAPNPHALILGALGACTTMTLQMYANRKGWDLSDVTVKLDEGKTRIPGKAGVIPLITKDIEVKGNLSADQVKQLKTIAEKCPVNQLIMGEKQMNSRLDLVV